MADCIAIQHRVQLQLQLLKQVIVLLNIARTGLGLELPYMVGLGLPNLEVRSKLFIIKSIVENSRILLCLHSDIILYWLHSIAFIRYIAYDNTLV